MYYRWRAPKLLDRLKCESKMKTTKEQGLGARSLARSTLRVERCVEAPGWGLGRMTSINHSHGPAQNQTSWLMHNCSTFSVKMSHGRPWTHKTHHGPDSKEATTFPLIVYFVPSHWTNTQMAFCPRTPKWESRNSQSWDSYNFGGP